MSSFEVFTYSPRDINLIISGHKVVGWNSIRVSLMSPSFRVIKGIRGKNTRVRDVDSSATVALSLDQTSVSNSLLEQIAFQDKQTGNGRLSVSLSNPHGSEMFFSDTAFIEGKSDIMFEGEITGREWVIHCLQSDQSSGSDKLGGMIGSILGGLF